MINPDPVASHLHAQHEGSLDAHINRDDPGDRNDRGRHAAPGSDLRPELSGLPADLWQERQLYLLPLYVDPPMPAISLRPRRPMHHEPLLCRRWSPQTPRVLLTAASARAPRTAASSPSPRPSRGEGRPTGSASFSSTSMLQARVGWLISNISAGDAEEATMARTKSFQTLVHRQANTDKKFAEALLSEGIDAMLSGDTEIGKTILHDYIKRPRDSRNWARRPARRPRA
jgi:hypothetical protein